MQVILEHNKLSERLNNLWCEVRYGISTRGIVDIDHQDSYHYATMNYSTIQRMIRFLSLQASDTFVDIGSGRGRMLCCAARYPVRKVVGIDLSKDLCEQARRNAESLRGRHAPIVVHNGLADEFQYDEGTVFALFNPFGAATLDVVLGKIRAARKGTAVRIAYANPKHDEIFTQHSWLEKYAYWDKKALALEHSISFYRSKA
jgi:cyclopropane fatty-acyl-phospholipid synthase-like methyltransferase